MSEALSETLIVEEVQVLEHPDVPQGARDHGFGRRAPCFARRSFSSDPELTPIRIGMPRSRAARTTSRTFAGEPMLPGLIRKRVHAGVDRGRGPAGDRNGCRRPAGGATFLRISPKAAAACASGTARRTISQPAFSSRRIWATVARMSRVSVLVMDWTEIGAPPPMRTSPILICLVFRLGKKLTFCVSTVLILTDLSFPVHPATLGTQARTYAATSGGSGFPDRAVPQVVRAPARAGTIIAPAALEREQAAASRAAGVLTNIVQDDEGDEEDEDDEPDLHPDLCGPWG